GPSDYGLNSQVYYGPQGYIAGSPADWVFFKWDRSAPRPSEKFLLMDMGWGRPTVHPLNSYRVTYHFRHNNGLNMLFFDGHVEWRTPEKVPSWNNWADFYNSPDPRPWNTRR
ncbi:MAG: H-X9-DG-CTERM domain-containing protein, partial [Candidatus Ratteibacteria bacterium]